MNRLSGFVIGIASLVAGLAAAAEALKIPRIIPPPGIEVPAEELDRITAELAKTEERLAPFLEPTERPRWESLPDVEIYVKAVRYAVDHGEFYDAKDPSRALDLLKTANERLDLLSKGTKPWTRARGLVVRGFRSYLDDSVQPYGLVISEKLDLSQPVPLYVWLHGRGDKVTDLQFIHQRERSVGQIAPENAIVLHPFGRYCNAFKFAGETDVREAMRAVMDNYKIDQDRVALWGFSMGGAGAWHLAAHHPEYWVAVSPGAGFAETARYQKLDPSMVPEYERKLWGWYDAPDYVRNLFNIPVIAYSGELDKQIQAVRVMEEAYLQEGKQLTHLIGPGVEHKYHPDVLAEIARRIEAEVAKGVDRTPKTISYQTRTLQYPQIHWVTLDGLEEHWKDSRVDAQAEEGKVTLKTKNVSGLSLARTRTVSANTAIEIDGTRLTTAESGHVHLERVNGEWRFRERYNRGIHKGRLVTGPIDDAFTRAFIVVAPTGRAAHPKVQQWVDAELAHFKDRWRRLFRGDLQIKKDTEVDLKTARVNLILWGDRSSNRLIEQLASELPIAWNESAITVGEESFDASGHVLSMIYPNPGRGVRPYVVLNSGPTFREAHDRSNSLQTPKLPDWAVIDLSQPPDDKAPGKIAAAGFFDERWQLKRGGE